MKMEHTLVPKTSEIKIMFAMLQFLVIDTLHICIVLNRNVRKKCILMNRILEKNRVLETY